MKEAEPARGSMIAERDGVWRIVARNSGPFTYHGTNTWLVADAAGYTVIDPGPEDAEHVADILRLTEGRIGAIVVTHTHHDHIGAAPGLAAACGVPVQGWHRSAEEKFTPDIGLQDGDTVGRLRAVFTPGHAADHVCFALDDGTLFTGDHIMTWNTSVIVPPRGNMRAYMESLRRVLDRGDARIAPAHGPVMEEPRRYIEALFAHRMMRERSIQRELATGHKRIPEIAEVLYANVDARVRPAAERNVLAHLLKLEEEGSVRQDGEIWHAA